MSGEVLHIHIAPAAEATPTPVDSVRAEPGRGLEGDRYHAQKGTYSGDGRSGREVTLTKVVTTVGKPGVQVASIKSDP